MRSDPFVRISCGTCGDEIEVDLPILEQNIYYYDDRKISVELLGLGWRVTETGQDQCEWCSERLQLLDEKNEEDLLA